MKTIQGKYKPLTLICYMRSQKISLLPIGQTAEPPPLVVFVQHLDDITAAYGQFIRSIRFVVTERDNLEEEHRGGGVGYEEEGDCM